MPADVKWETEDQTVLVFTLQGLWTLEDYYRIHERSKSMMSTVEHKVNWIIDVRNSQTLPNGFISAVRSVSKTPHPNTGRAALLGVNPYVRVFVKTVRKLLTHSFSGQWMQMVGSMEEAHAFFEEKT